MTEGWGKTTHASFLMPFLFDLRNTMSFSEASMLALSTALVPRAFESSGYFSTVPVEIIQNIASSLPLCASVALSISNHMLYRIVGSQYLEQVRQNDVQLHAFNQLLDRDILESYLCSWCRTLHILTKLEGWSATLTDADRFDRISRLPCQMAGGKRYPENQELLHWHTDKIPFAHWILALKLHRKGFTDRAASLHTLRPNPELVGFLGPVCFTCFLNPVSFSNDDIHEHNIAWSIKKSPGYSLLKISSNLVLSCATISTEKRKKDKTSITRY